MEGTAGNGSLRKEGCSPASQPRAGDSCASHSSPRVGHAERALPFRSHQTRATHRALPGTCRGGQATVCGHLPPKKKTVFVPRDKPGEVTGREMHPRTQKGEGHATARGQGEGGRWRLAVVPAWGLYWPLAQTAGGLPRATTRAPSTGHGATGHHPPSRPVACFQRPR